MNKVLWCLADAAWHGKPVDTSSLTEAEKELLPADLPTDEPPSWELVDEVLAENSGACVDVASLALAISHEWLASRKVEFGADDIASLQISDTTLPSLLLPLTARSLHATWKDGKLVLTEKAQDFLRESFERSADLENKIAKMRGDMTNKFASTMELLDESRFKWPDS